MKRRLIAGVLLAAYTTLLVKVMVFKDMPLIKIGSLMLNFGGTNTGEAANFIPFKTILPYLLGHKGLIIAGINLAGNIVLLVPVGFLVAFIYQKRTWKMATVFAITVGLSIEVLQVILRVGIFDIDDVILNALGFMMGYFGFVVLAKWLREKRYKNIIITAIIGVVAAALFYVTVVYPIMHQPLRPDVRAGVEI